MASNLNEFVADDLETCRVVLEMIADIREQAEDGSKGHGQIKIEIADGVRTWWDYTIKHRRKAKPKD